MEKTQQVSVTHQGKTRTFVVTNKCACSKSKRNPDGVKYLTDAEFSAHVEDQRRGAIRNIEAEIQEGEAALRQSRTNELRAKRKAGKKLTAAEQHELLDLFLGV